MMIFEKLLDLIYPRRAVCMGCGAMTGCERDDICETCREKLSRAWVGVHPVDPGLMIDGAAFAYRYRGAAGGIVRNMKYRSVWVLSDRMGRDTARAAQRLNVGADCIVTCIPMHPRRIKRRGRNHAALIAKAAADQMGLEYAELLVRTRNVRQQARLSDAQRRANMDGAFVVHPDMLFRVREAKVLVVDDVFTTGSTAGQAAKALRNAGAKYVYFAAYSHGGERRENENG